MWKSINAVIYNQFTNLLVSNLLLSNNDDDLKAVVNENRYGHCFLFLYENGKYYCNELVYASKWKTNYHKDSIVVQEE